MAMTIAAPEAQAAGKVKDVSVSNLPAKTLTLKKGKSKTLKAKVTVSGKASKKVTWKSSNKKIVTVTKKGKVTAKKKGKAKISVTSVANKKRKATITVTVGTPSTKVKLNKKSGQLYVGQKATVKATVSPSKASNKKVVWTTSKKSVATVSSKGVVKAVKAGTAKITATAADGSGKKATYTVKVLNPVTLAEVKAIDSNAIQVTLSEAQQLTKDNFSVMTKRRSNGQYIKAADIQSIQTNDNKTYIIILKDNSYLYEGYMIQVTVAGLNGSGTLSAETIYSEGAFSYQETDCRELTVGEKCRIDIQEELYYYEKNLSISGLPEGLSYNASSGYIYGTPAKAGVSTSTMTYKDELGNTTTCEFIWLIGDKNAIAAAYLPYYGIKGASELYMGRSIRVIGGSGVYTYKIVGDANGFEIDEDGYIWGHAKMAGKYTVQVQVTDQNNQAPTQTVNAVFDVIAGRTITGTITDNAGNAVPNASICFVSKNKANRYNENSGSFWREADKKGYYEVTLPDDTYTVNISNNAGSRVYDEATQKYYDIDAFNDATGDYNRAEAHILNYKVSSDAMNQNFTLPYTMTKVESANQNGWDEEF